MIRNNRYLALTVLLTFWSVFCAAQPLWPGVSYDSRIPTIKAVLGYDMGAQITDVVGTRRYFEALARSAPAQVRLFEYATSWEGRPLFYAVIGQNDQITALDQFADDMQALADPATAQRDVERIVERVPGSVWLAYSVHGNEISSTDAAMMSAYHLLAARDDEVVQQILANTLVFINPIQNPDGRDRFVRAHEQAQGIEPIADRQAAEHDEPWPSGRVNHYLFDLNRDWIVATQPETRGHIQALQRWYPLVFVDLHEMGSDSTYYFAPEAVPYNPHLAPAQRKNLQLFGRNNARWFDQFGIDYFTREVFDAFYPGYGASWPAYYGAVAMTYEQASSRGLRVRRRDGSEFSYRDAVRNHFVTSISTAQAVAANRGLLLQDFRDYRTSAVAEGKSGIRSYLISAAPDRSAADRLAGILALQGIAVRRATEPFSACSRDYPAGSYIVSLEQAAKRLIRTLLDPQVDMEARFLAEQERRRAKDLPDEIYDVTSWSLPLMFGLDAAACNRQVSAASEAVKQELIRPASLQEGGASVAYLAPWGTQAAVRLLGAALRQGLHVRSTGAAFRMGEQRYPAGTLIFKVAENPVDLGPRLAALAKTTGAEIRGVSQSWVDEGPNFGSNKVVTLRAPRIALAWDAPTSPYSAGQTRFVIERQFNYPVTPIRVSRLAGADLSGYDVLILPASRGSYDVALTANLKSWTEAGGTLVALGSAVRFLADPEVDLISIRREQAVVSDSDAAKEKASGKTVPGKHLASESDYQQQLAPLTDQPDSVAGVLVRAAVDPDHWLGAGVQPQLNVLVRGADIYSPIRLDQGRNVAHFVAADQLLSSGYLWQENREQLAFKPFVVLERRGAGHVIAFTQDPNVRAYLDGLNILFANAIMRAPAHSRRAR